MYDKKKLIDELQNEFVRSKKVYLATDPDREGEAISWHLAHLLDMDPHEARRPGAARYRRDTLCSRAAAPG